MTDGPGSVSTVVLVLPEDKLAELDVDVTEGDNDCGERVDGKRDKGVGSDKYDGDDAPKGVANKIEGNRKEDVDKTDSESAAEARAAIRRVGMAEDRMDVQ
jgi:hypothetical protein